MKETEYKGKKAYLLENSTIRVLIVPELGGKIVSVCRKDSDFELLYQNHRAPVTDQGFAAGEACGCDDAFPAIDEETVMVGEKSILYPDHGEIWSSSMTVEDTGGLCGCLRDNRTEDEQDEIALSCASRILPYHYYKKIDLLEDGFQVYYRISNTGTKSFPCLWVLHDLVRYEEDMELIYPKDTEAFLNVFENQELGLVGTYYPYDSQDGSR